MVVSGPTDEVMAEVEKIKAVIRATPYLGYKDLIHMGYSPAAARTAFWDMYSTGEVKNGK